MLEKKISLFTNNKGNEFLTQLEATLELSDKLDSVVEAVKSIPQTVIPETVIPEYPSEMVISNLPDIQKVEITNLPTEKDDKEQLALLKEISQELKKKEEYAYDIEIDSTLKEQLRGEKGESGKDGKNGTEITPNEVALKLESLEGDERLDVSAVKGTEELIDDIATSIVKAEIKKIPKPTVYMGARGSSSSGGSGDVAGPSSSTDNAITRYDGTTGKLIQDSSITISDDAVISNINATQFDITPSAVTPAEGLLQWNSTEGTLDLGMSGGNIIQQIGQEQFFYVKNQTGATLSNGKPVMFAGSLGASGRLKAQYAIADGSLNSEWTMGIVTHDILNGDDGFVTQFGKVRNIDTTGTPYGEVWADGDILYISPTVAGGLTKVKPNAPNLQITVAAVVNAHAVNGTLFVRPTWKSKLQDLDDINGTALTTTGQILVWNQTSGYFDFDYNINNYEIVQDTVDVTSSQSVDTNQFVRADASNGSITITINTPTAKQTVTIKKVDSTSNSVYVTSPSLIDGDTTAELSMQHESITLKYTGSTFDII